MPTLNKVREDQAGSSYYEPLTVTVEAVSQYRENEFKFVDLPGYWQWQGTVGALVVGQPALVALKTKPKTGPNSRPGAEYMDVIDVREADPNDVQYDQHRDPVGATQAGEAGYDDPGWGESPATHTPRSGPDWQDEAPSFHTWKERGIQKMSALKAAVEYLSTQNSSEVDALAWRLMNELANDAPHAPAPQEGEEARE